MGRFKAEVWHNGLQKYRVISASSRYEAKMKGDAQLARWEEQYQNQLDRERLREDRKELRYEKEKQKQSVLAKKDKARELTLCYQDQTLRLQNIFNSYINEKTPFNVHDLKDFSEFTKLKPDYPTLPTKPDPKNIKYKADIGFFDLFSSEKKLIKRREADALFRNDLNAWEIQQRALINEYDQKVYAWEKEKETFYKVQQEKNIAYEKLEKAYMEQIPKAIILYFRLILLHLKFPLQFEQKFDIKYDQKTKILMVNYLLPKISDIPNIKEVKYIQNRDEFNEIRLSDSIIKRIYEDVIFQIVMQCISEIFLCDRQHSLHGTIFNGFIRRIDPAIGKISTFCILSSNILREEFSSLNLNQIDPLACLLNSGLRCKRPLANQKPIEPNNLF